MLEFKEKMTKIFKERFEKETGKKFTEKVKRTMSDIYNHKNSELRREARDLRIQSYRNLDKAVVNYMVEYEALETTPRSVIEKVVAHAKQDYDEWWNYLSRYLEFAEDILSVIKED